jgi:hypothetical protein
MAIGKGSRAPRGEFTTGPPAGSRPRLAVTPGPAGPPAGKNTGGRGGGPAEGLAHPKRPEPALLAPPVRGARPESRWPLPVRAANAVGGGGTVCRGGAACPGPALLDGGTDYLSAATRPMCGCKGAGSGGGLELPRGRGPGGSQHQARARTLHAMQFQEPLERQKVRAWVGEDGPGGQADQEHCGPRVGEGGGWGGGVGRMQGRGTLEAAASESCVRVAPWGAASSESPAAPCAAISVLQSPTRARM